MIKTLLLVLAVLTLTFCSTESTSEKEQTPKKKEVVEQEKDASTLICECFSSLDSDILDDSLKVLYVQCITDVIGEEPTLELREKTWDKLYENCDAMFDLVDSKMIKNNGIDTVKQAITVDDCASFKNIRLTSATNEKTFLTIREDKSIYEDQNGVQNFSLKWSSPCSYTSTTLDGPGVNYPPSQVEFYNISGDTLTLKVSDSKRNTYMKLIK